MQKQSSFLRYIHNFRGLAILLIVVAHTMQFLIWQDHPKLEVFLNVLLGNGSVYFVFIAGFLFQYLSRKYAYKTYVISKLHNVLLPYFIISIPAIFYLLLRGSPGILDIDNFFDLPLLGKIIAFYVTGDHLFPLWFIPMISLYYLLAPSFIWIDRHPKAYWIIPALLLVTLYVNRTPENHIIPTAIHFLSIYVLGMVSSHYREQLSVILKHNWFFLVFIATSLTVYETLIRAKLYLLEDMLSVNTISKAILCIFLMYVFWRFDAIISDFYHFCLGVLANFSFGIFFLHGYFSKIYFSIIYRYFGMESFWVQANILTFLILLTFQLVGSIFVIHLLKLILHKKSRYLIGC
uniref:Acyltransferase domain, membrane protein n=1 Tax=Cyanothece sp. (strain PCC 7425 / ATCC 29141) TaxID=395961 RepID=B8HV87_CYAP4